MTIGPVTSHGHKIPNVPDNGIVYTGPVARCSAFLSCQTCKDDAKNAKDNVR